MDIQIQDHIRIVPDFPKDGINFYDISTLLSHPGAWREAIGQLHAKVESYEPDMLMGIESRGFLVAAPLALEMGVGVRYDPQGRKTTGRDSAPMNMILSTVRTLLSYSLT